MSVTFAKGATTVTLPNPAQRIAMSHIKRQTISRTQGGNVRVHDLGVDTYELRLSFEMLTASEKADLQSFFDSDVDGAMETWTYTDENGNTYTARFLDAELAITKTMNDMYEAQVRIEVDSMPS